MPTTELLLLGYNIILTGLLLWLMYELRESLKDHENTLKQWKDSNDIWQKALVKADQDYIRLWNTKVTKDV